MVHVVHVVPSTARCVEMMHLAYPRPCWQLKCDKPCVARVRVCDCLCVSRLAACSCRSHSRPSSASLGAWSVAGLRVWQGLRTVELLLLYPEAAGPEPPARWFCLLWGRCLSGEFPSPGYLGSCGLLRSLPQEYHVTILHCVTDFCLPCLRS